MNRAIINCETGEEITETLTDAEIDEIKRTAEAEAQVSAEAAAVRAAILDKLGITEEEAKLLLS